ncbi:iron-sulfur cluster scaffold protein Nfu [Thraustotheca clavata]|uniref:Iron-sulfur cluster scaffold protein Nfu n=1 Tax=Thraustotheca clavata TaxID=74557 RepID=A0A1V9Y8Q5_9STRA|nr:iron-sulfur cluster scaffold protein Nfu [Thraustotheca clavata]
MQPALEMQLEGELQPMDPDMSSFTPRSEMVIHQFFFNDFGDDFDDEDVKHMLRAVSVFAPRFLRVQRVLTPRSMQFHALKAMPLKPMRVFAVPSRSMFIQTESTPNPHSIKFLPGRPVLDERFTTGVDFTPKAPEVRQSELARELFKIDGVNRVFFGKDFVSITKDEDEDWEMLRGQIFATIMDFYATGKPVMLDKPEITDTTILDDDDEVVAMIKELLETRIRPAVQDDGGDIFYKGFDEETGIVKVQLAGSCVGCASSSVTLKNGVENMLMHYIPEVTGVEEVDDGLKDINENEFKTLEERLRAAGIPSL